MKLRLRAATAAALASVAAGCTIADQETKYRIFFRETAQSYVPGFRLPDESQYGPLWALVEGHQWRTRDGSGQTKAEFWTSGDFNGDATIDYAYILVEAATGARTLLAFVSTADGYAAHRLDSGFDWGIWLRTRPPGHYAAVSVPDGGDDPVAATGFDASSQFIDFFEFGGSSSSFVWNAAAQSFDRYRTE